MGRWSRLTCCTGLLAVSGCAIPSYFTSPGTERVTTTNAAPAVTPMVSTAKTKDTDLPPDQASKLCMATAEELEKNGHYDQAINQYELALKHQPRSVGVGRKLAGCYAKQGQYDQAIGQYQKELVVTPKDADLLNDLGYTYYEKEDFTNAEKYLNQALVAKPGYQRAYGNLGLVLGRQQKWRDCLEAFKKAGNPATAQANLAAMYLTAGKSEDAKRCCNIALGLDPSLKTAKELLAKIESLPAEDGKAILQAEARLSQDSGASSGKEQATAVQLQRPVRSTRHQEPLEFRPVK